MTTVPVLMTFSAYLAGKSKHCYMWGNRSKKNNYSKCLKKSNFLFFSLTDVDLSVESSTGDGESMRKLYNPFLTTAHLLSHSFSFFF